jgi:hypothetical protein
MYVHSCRDSCICAYVFIMQCGVRSELDLEWRCFIFLADTSGTVLLIMRPGMEFFHFAYRCYQSLYPIFISSFSIFTDYLAHVQQWPTITRTTRQRPQLCGPTEMRQFSLRLSSNRSRPATEGITTPRKRPGRPARLPLLVKRSQGRFGRP